LRISDCELRIEEMGNGKGGAKKCGVEYYMWCGFFAPKGTPPDILKTLREASRKAAASPEFKAAMEKMNTPIDYRDADDFRLKFAASFVKMNLKMKFNIR
jgi:tripartite-type tricarboxylate transporter receptor subunit TctC